MKDMLYVFAGFKYYPQRPSKDFVGQYHLTRIIAGKNFISDLKSEYDWYEMWSIEEDGLKLKFSWTKEF